ncbi:MAG: polysaccharide deacetylase family protein, partial [Patescibacteria group bacterium]
MADYHRYQPHRSSSSLGSWGRWLVVGVVVVVLVLIGRLIFGGKKSTTKTGGNDTAAISLLTDNANTNASTTDTNGSTNTNLSSPEMVITSGNWKGFSVKQCPNAISSFGTTKQVVLTVAMSAANDQAQQALDALKQAGLPADIFVSGSFAAKNSALVKSIAQAGHAVYSQSYNSANLAAMSDADVLSAISTAESAIVSATAISPKPIFRPPSGNYTAQTVKLLNQQGYCAVLWTVDAYDWQDGITAAQAQERVLTALDKQSGGAIVSLHAGYDITPQLITDLVAALKAKGLAIVTLATLLN